MPKIVSARVIVTSPGRNFVTLKIECDDGTTGVGDATLNGRELAVASYLADHVVPCLIGRDAHGYVALYRYLQVIDTALVLAIRAKREGGYALP